MLFLDVCKNKEVFIMIVKHTSIKMKLFLILLSIMILTTVLVSMTLYSQAKSSIQKQTADAIKGSITLTVENIDTSLKNIENTFVPIAINDERLHSILSTETPFDRYEIITNYAYILGNLRNLSSQLKGFDSYSLYMDNQQDLLDTKSTFYLDVKPSEIDFMRRFPKNHADQLWFVTYPYGSDNAANKKAVISSVRVIQNQDYKALGYISLNVNESYIYNLFAKLDPGVQSVILDKQDTIISSADKTTIGTSSERYSTISNRIHASEQPSGSFEYEEGEQKYLAVYSSSAYTHWLFIHLIPMEQIIGQVSKTRLFMIEVIGVTSLLLLAISYIVSFLFYKPIRKLVVAMKRIENRDLTVKITDSRRDEYQRVYQGFNDMVDNLNNLMNDLTSEKILKKEALTTPSFPLKIIKTCSAIARSGKWPGTP
jgi:two-component system sensor histidine kinase YesM